MRLFCRESRDLKGKDNVLVCQYTTQTRFNKSPQSYQTNEWLTLLRKLWGPV